MISRQNIIAVFMALLLTIFLLGCTSKQAEKQEAPTAVPEAAPEEASPSSEMPVPSSDTPEAVVAEAPEEPEAVGEGAY